MSAQQQNSILARDCAITVLDFESTGVVTPYPDEPWQLGMVSVAHGRIVSASCYTSLLHVGDRPFSRHAPGRHVSLRAQLAGAPRLPDLWPALRPRLTATPLAAHNTATEKRFLRAAFPMHPLGPWIDTLKLSRMAFPTLHAHTLTDVLASLNLESRVREVLAEGEPHDALYDAVGCAAVLEAILAMPGWEQATLAGLAAASPSRFHRRVSRRRAGGA